MTCAPLQSWRDFQLECALRAAMLRTMDEKHAAKALDRAVEALEAMTQANRLKAPLSSESTTASKDVREKD